MCAVSQNKRADCRIGENNKMSYQSKTPQFVKDLFDKKNISVSFIDYYAWPVTFPDTTGPRGGIGGQAMSTFTVQCYVANGGCESIKVCDGYYYFDNSKFEPFKTKTNGWIKIKE